MAIAERYTTSVEGLEFGPGVVVVIPAYNQERFIGSSVLQVMKSAYRVIVVDGGSSDATAEIAKLAGATVVRHEHNQNKDMALMTGLKKAYTFGPDVVVTLAPEGHNLMAEMMRLANPIIEKTADITIGSSNAQNSFCALSGPVLETILSQPGTLSVERTLQHITQNNNLRVTEVPITTRSAETAPNAEQPATQKEGPVLLEGLLRMGSQNQPLRFFGVSGISMVAIGLLLAAWVSSIYTTAQGLALGYALVAVILVLVGLLLSFTGIMLHLVHRMLVNLSGQASSTDDDPHYDDFPWGGPGSNDKISYTFVNGIATVPMPSSLHSLNWSSDNEAGTIISLEDYRTAATELGSEEEKPADILKSLGERWPIPDKLYTQVYGKGKEKTAQPAAPANNATNSEPTQNIPTFGEADYVRASVVIVHQDKNDMLHQCVESVLRAAHPDDELVVVDAASPDGSLEAIAQRFPRVQIVRSESTLGTSGNNNLGAQHARGKYIAFLHPNTLVEAGWIDALISQLETTPRAGLATPRMLLLNNPATTTTCGTEMHYTGLTSRRGTGTPTSTFATTEEVSAIAGAAFVMRQELFYTLGGFDETFSHAMGDTDLSLRARIAGYQCLYVASAVVYHGDSLLPEPHKTLHAESGRYRMLLKNLEWQTLLLLTPALLLTELLTWGTLFTRDRLRITNKLRAYAAILRNPGSIMQQRKQIQPLRRIQDCDIIRMCSTYLPFDQHNHSLLTRLSFYLYNPWFALWKEALLVMLNRHHRPYHIQQEGQIRAMNT